MDEMIFSNKSFLKLDKKLSNSLNIQYSIYIWILNKISSK